MRYTFVIFTFLSLTFFGCESAKYEKQIQDLQTKNEKQIAENEAQKAYIEQVTKSVVEIQRNLNLIQLRQEKIAKVSSDIEKSPERSDSTLKQNILKNISDIDQFLLDNQRALKALEDDLKNSEFQISNIENLVTELKFSIIQREKQILALKEEVRNLNVQINALQNTVDVLDQVIYEQEKELSKAYYIIGTEDELEQQGVVEIKGGVLGLLGRTLVPTNTFNEEKFKVINTITTDSISVQAPIDGFEILTIHEKSSYSLVSYDQKKTWLVIQNPYEFWMKSKFLIIVVTN